MKPGPFNFQPNQKTMKKFIFLMLTAVLLCMVAGMSSCKSCGKGEPGEPIVEKAVQADYDGVVVDFTAGVDHIQSLHRQKMYTLNDGANYEWRNSKVLFNDTITWENIDELKVVEVTDVFFYWNSEGPHVQFIATNVKDGTIIYKPIRDVWIEDDNLSDKEVKLSADDVLQRLKEFNGLIPPAISMSLRYPVGPCECNAQWVVGDAYDVIFVDAVTGDVSNWNPAFNPNNTPKGGDFGKPLGEWP